MLCCDDNGLIEEEGCREDLRIVGDLNVNIVVVGLPLWLEEEEVVGEKGEKTCGDPPELGVVTFCCGFCC